MTIFTANIEDELIITQSDSIYRLSVKANGGTVQITGTVPEFKGIPATPITLQDGQAVVLEAWPQSGVNCTITPDDGTADVIICFG